MWYFYYYFVPIVSAAVLTASANNNENCNFNLLQLSILVRVDSQPQHFNTVVDGVISYEADAFVLTVTNQSLPKLCKHAVKIENELTVLHINNVSLQDIEPGAFIIQPTLAILKISHNPLTTLRNGVFGNLNVKELDLTHNFISLVETAVFDNITKLEVVRLSYNAIKNINPNWFYGSPQVYKLSIIYNELTSLPAKAFKNMAKTHRGLRLRLSANMINEIHPDAFSDAGDIDILWMNGNKITHIPDSLFTNRTINRLELNTNKLTCFPELIYKSKIRVLAFIENQNFACSCLEKVRSFVIQNQIDIWYPAIICEDRKREVNIVFNFNKTYELPLQLPSGG